MGQALWFASRATGLVALVLLTGTVVLGCAHSGRVGGGAWPRFTLHAVHRNLSLLTLLFVAVHAAAAVVDPYAGLRWIDVVVPFGSGYHPLWLGLGSIALDIMLAVVLTSLVRTRIPHRAWRALHLTAYALWPVALVHGWGIGGADRSLPWVIGLEIVCGALAAGALTRRLLVRHADPEARRAAAAAQ